MERRDLIRTFAGLAVGNFLRGQDAPAPTFSSNVKVVNVFATVRNGNGEIVRNLNKEDFVLKEDGRLQEIKYFSRETDLPLTIGFVVDTSGSTKKVLPDERMAARAFIDQVLREDKDQAFVLHFDKEVELLRDLTNSKPKLQKGIDLLESAQPQQQADSGGGGGYPGGGTGGGGMGGRGGGGWPGGGGGGYPGGGGGRRGGGGAHHAGTLLYDAILLASDEIMKKQKGRKALILMSDGDDSGSKTTMRGAISSAQRSDSLIYAVFFKGETGNFRGGGGGRRGGAGYPQEDRPDGKKVMEQLSTETGGAMIAVTGKTHVDQALTQIGEELRSQYSLGYSSDSKSTDTEFRKIALVSTKPGLTIQTREGYWSDGE